MWRARSASSYGLGSYVLTTDPDHALRVADRLEAGMVFVNAVGAEASSCRSAASSAPAWAASTNR